MGSGADLYWKENHDFKSQMRMRNLIEIVNALIKNQPSIRFALQELKKDLYKSSEDVVEEEQEDCID